MPKSVLVNASSRLHFGMLTIRQEGVRHSQGIGCMLAEPGLEIRLEKASALRVEGPHAARVSQIINDLASNDEDLPDSLGVSVEVSAHSAPHNVGLGTGTQLAFSIATGVRRLFDLPPLEMDSIARFLGRARRSAVGTHGFYHGGFLVDGGKKSDKVAPLLARAPLPEQWRFALFIRRDDRGLAGREEDRAISDLPPFPTELSCSMCSDVLRHLLPSLHDRDFATFSSHLYQYNLKAGFAFAPVQAGSVYKDTSVTTLISRLRRSGIIGVGQSSWGPTVFALCEDTGSAQDCIDRIGRDLPEDRLDMIIARPTNAGASIIDS